ncbi:MAG: hypothetical protein WBE38_19330 [Terracidiphilus sp.]|jgi:hypothetical protein
MPKFLLAALLLAVCPLLIAQQTLNNDAVIKLVKAGLSDDLIIATINAQPGTYDVSPDGLVALKTSGASDKLVAAIIARAGAPTTPPAAIQPAGVAAVPPPAPTDPDDPMSKHDVGVYLMTTNHEGKPQMIFIDRAGEAGVKTANLAGAAFSYGIAKAKLKAEIPGPHAATRAMQARPVFYMYFPEMSSLGSFGGTDMISSPNQFTLMRLEEKKDHRETQIGKVGMFSQQVGADEKKEFLFSSERVKSGMYKITPKEDLKPNEYAFIMATQGAGRATGTTVVIYDFGVDLR